MTEAQEAGVILLGLSTLLAVGYGAATTIYFSYRNRALRARNRDLRQQNASLILRVRELLEHQHHHG